MPENEIPPERKLQRAVAAGNLDEVRSLCEQGVDEDTAREWGPDFRSSLLLTAIKPDLDFSNGSPPKVKATGHTNIIAYLLSRGANPTYIYVEEYDRHPDQTLLHWAARYGYKDIAALLIQYGADVNAKWQATGDTPLGSAVHSYENDDNPPDEATMQRLFDTIRLLVEKGADVNFRNNTEEYPDDIGETVLFRVYAPELIKYLVAKGADVNARDNLGWTPLHKLALYTSGTTKAQALIDCGADVNARDKQGRTPLDLALANDKARSDHLKNLLLSYQTPQPVYNAAPRTPADSGGTSHDFDIAANHWRKACAARKSLNKENAYTLEQGMMTILNGDLKLAHQALDRATGESDANMRILRGALFHEEGNVLEEGSIVGAGGRGKKYVEQAIEAYRKSIQFYPKSTPYYMLGLVCVQANRIEEAKAAFRSAAELNDGEANIEAQTELNRLDAQYPSPVYNYAQPGYANPQVNFPPGGYHSAQPQAGYSQGWQPQGMAPPGLNWGAFLLPFIWGPFNNVWIGLVALVGFFSPFLLFISLGVSIYLLIGGNEMAWKAKPWQSVEQFYTAQQIWYNWGLAAWVVMIILDIMRSNFGGSGF